MTEQYGYWICKNCGEPGTKRIHGCYACMSNDGKKFVPYKSIWKNNATCIGNDVFYIPRIQELIKPVDMNEMPVVKEHDRYVYKKMPGVDLLTNQIEYRLEEYEWTTIIPDFSGLPYQMAKAADYAVRHSDMADIGTTRLQHTVLSLVRYEMNQRTLFLGVTFRIVGTDELVALNLSMEALISIQGMLESKERIEKQIVVTKNDATHKESREELTARVNKLEKMMEELLKKPNVVIQDSVIINSQIGTQQIKEET